MRLCLQTGEHEKTLNHKGVVTSLCVDGNVLLSAGYEGLVRCFDLRVSYSWSSLGSSSYCVPVLEFYYFFYSRPGKYLALVKGPGKTLEMMI